MIQFLSKKIFSFLLGLWFISLFAFFLIRFVPGDPVMVLLGERGGNPETYLAMKKSLGLDRPVVVQYGMFLKRLVQFDLGQSIVSKRSVWEEFIGRFPATVELGVCAFLFGALIGIPLGLFAAVKENSFFDYFNMTLSLVGYSMPIFWWGPMLILFFSVWLGLTPVSGRINILYDVDTVTGFMLIDSWFSEDGAKAFFSSLKHLVLPAVAMGTIPMAILARMSRASMLEVLGEDYIKTAKAKGVKPSKIMWVHALRNALIPIITVAGLIFGSIITGAILTETIFSWPGIGKWLVKSIEARDYPVIQSGIVLIATMIIMTNFLVDMVYYLIDPRLKKKS